MGKWILITFDWPDGVWKTTLAKLLAERNDGVYFRTPGSATKEERARYDNPNVSIQERCDYYTRLLLEDTCKIHELIEGGKSVFCDRFAISTIVHHKALDGQVDISKASEILKRVWPSCSIILHWDISVLMDRVMSRESQTRFELDRGLVEKTQKDFLWFPHTLAFDNTNCELEETAFRITSRLRELAIL